MKKVDKNTIGLGKRKSEIAMLASMGAPWAIQWVNNNFSRQERFIFELIINGRFVTKESGIVVSPLRDKTYVINTFTGGTRNYKNEEYATKLGQESLSLKKQNKGSLKYFDWECVVYQEESNFNGIRLYRSWTTGSKGKYTKIVIEDSVLGKFKILEHFVIGAFKFGFEILNAMSANAEFDVHHGDINRWNNAAYNLQLILHTEHVELHNRPKDCLPAK